MQTICSRSLRTLRCSTYKPRYSQYVPSLGVDTRFPFISRISRYRNMADTSIPKSMPGILIERTGGVEVLQWKTDLPVPEPKENEVLVKNEYIGVNFIDT